MEVKDYGSEVSPGTMQIGSCGHIFTFPGREVDRPVGRPDWLLLYIFRGNVRFFFEGREELAASGDFILYAPHEPQHHIYAANHSGEFYFIHFTAASYAELLGMESARLYHSEPSPDICGVFEEIISELQLKGKGYTEVCQALLVQLFIKVNRRVFKNEKTLLPTGVTAVVQYINKHYEENQTLEEYAQMCGISKYYFLRQFKKLTGLSPLKYRAGLRILRAKELLSGSGKSIKEISELLGFSSPAYFSAAFRASEGVFPYRYRENQQCVPEQYLKDD